MVIEITMQLTQEPSATTLNTTRVVIRENNIWSWALILYWDEYSEDIWKVIQDESKDIL